MRDIINPETVCIAFNPIRNMNEVCVSDYLGRGHLLNRWF